MLNIFRSCFFLTDIIIPNSVTSIGNEAFENCESLTSVYIPDSMKKIGSFAFNGCYSLTNVFCYAEEVPVANNWAFNDVHCENATLHVPAVSIEAYSNTVPWKDFGTIVALTDSDPKPTGVTAPSTTAQQPTIVERYDLNGRRASKTQRGISIVKMGDGTTKLISK